MEEKYLNVKNKVLNIINDNMSVDYHMLLTLFGDDKDVVLNILKKSSKNYPLYGKIFNLYKNDKDVVLQLIKIDASYFSGIKDDNLLKNDKEIILEAIARDRKSLWYTKLNEDKDFIYELYKKGYTGFYPHVSKEIKDWSHNSIKFFVKKYESEKMFCKILSNIDIKEENKKINKI